MVVFSPLFYSPFFRLESSLSNTMSNSQNTQISGADFSSTTTMEILFTGNNGEGSGGDLPSLQVAYWLNSKNYLKWSQLIRTFLKGKGKLSHLEETGPKDRESGVYSMGRRGFPSDVMDMEFHDP